MADQRAWIAEARERELLGMRGDVALSESLCGLSPDQMLTPDELGAWRLSGLSLIDRLSGLSIIDYLKIKDVCGTWTDGCVALDPGARPEWQGTCPHDIADHYSGGDLTLLAIEHVERQRLVVLEVTKPGPKKLLRKLCEIPPGITASYSELEGKGGEWATGLNRNALSAAFKVLRNAKFAIKEGHGQAATPRGREWYSLRVGNVADKQS